MEKGKDLLPSEKWIIRIDQAARNDDRRMFCSDDFNLEPT
jgi:hypothetical protein